MKSSFNEKQYISYKNNTHWKKTSFIKYNFESKKNLFNDGYSIKITINKIWK